MISVNQLSVHFTGEFIFDNISFIINDRDRIGLVGKNGVGKTTLLNIIAGKLEPEKGSIAFPSGSTVGYLPQEIITNSKRSVYREAMTAFDEVLKLKKKINEYSEQITSREDYHSESYLNIIDKLNRANERINLLGGNTIEAETEKVLLGLGFEKEDFDRSMSEFSGGWQMRVELAKILLSRPDLMMLDEPTNHLDIESIQWLEGFLETYSGAAIIVSHDRAFLDNVTNRTVEISFGKIYDYKACYSDYVLLREERMEQQMASYNNQQKQIEQIERFVNRFRYKATKARQVQSRLKMLDKIDKIEIDDFDTSSIKFRFPPAPHSGKIVLEVQDICKSYGERLVLKDLAYTVTRGERIAFVGRNGEGKTTMAKVIINELEYTGKIKLGQNVTIGYYAQNQADLLDGDLTVFETLDHVATGEMRTKTRGLLGSFLFGGDTIDKKVKVLSGGEKSRLALAKMLLFPVNLLVLDEPTNHLDMQSKDILKSALLKFDGTLLIVSHDRDFLQGLTNKVFEFRNQTIRQFPGDIYDFLDARRIDSLKQLEQVAKAQKLANSEARPSDSRNQYEKKRESDKELRKIKNRISKIEETVEKLEQQVKSIDEALVDPAKYKEIINDPEFYGNYQKLKKQLEEELRDWENLNLELERFQSS
ncbi:MAG: ABC-F family ATP-binding cassette domain-containing protein [Bacteroidota bacterium]